MKTVTANFEIAQDAINTFPIFRVYYKRRFWNGSTAYIYETNWTELTRDKFSRVQPITKQFDTQTQTEFKVSNIQLYLLNTENEWKDGNTSGKFGADGGSALGYEPYLMKFQIRAGFANVGESDERLGLPKASAGAEELLTMFTGVAIDWQTDSDSGVMKVTVEGMERLLTNGDAERVSTTETLETIRTGDGTTKDFFTENSGVGKITTVTVNAVTMTKGVDYTVSQLNDLNNGSKITLALPPESGQLVKCTYERWKVNKTVDQLITDLIAEAGITSSSISTATLGSISNNIGQSSKADFHAPGTGVPLNRANEPGSLIYEKEDNTALFQDFSSGTLTSNGWTTNPNAPVFRYSISGSEMRIDTTTNPATELNGQSISKSVGYTPNFGVWKFKIKVSSLGTNEVRIKLLANAASAATPGDVFLLMTNSYFKLRKISGDGTNIDLGESTSLGLTLGIQSIKVIRELDGTWEIFSGSDRQMTAKDSSIYSAKTIFEIIPDVVVDQVRIDDIYVPMQTPTGTFLSKALDTIGGLSAWGKLSVDQQSDSGVFTFETQSSTDAGTYDSLVAVPSNGAIASAVKRFIRVKITMTLAQAQLYTIQPKIFSFKVQFTSDRVFVAMGNFSGMTIHRAIQELAKLSDFEWGMNDDESFFFRTRTVSATPDETFTQSTNLADVVIIKTAYDKLFSTVRASFGSFVAEVVSSADVSTSALEIVGRRVFNVGSSILINQDTNIATPIATAFHTRLSVKRKNLKIRTKFFPQIELSDTLSITFKHDAFTAGLEPFVNALIVKVIATRHDLESWISEFECEEII